MRLALLLAAVLAVFILSVSDASAHVTSGQKPLAYHPAPASLRAWARHWYAVAVRARARDAKARACFGLCSPAFLAVRPRRSSSTIRWATAGRGWQAAACGLQADFASLRQRMKHPAGSGANRWRPLALWVGWPRATLDRLVRVIWRESTGRPWAVNASSGATGLLQLLPGSRDYFDPERNLRTGYVGKYLPSLARCGDGWRPWAATAY